MKPKARRARIAELVERDGEVSVDALAADFQVSPETIRRDLAALAGSGELQKFHGGARRIRLQTEESFDDRMNEAAAEKNEIGRKLAEVIAPGSFCFMDTGSTTLSCAHALSATEGLSIVTNSPRIAQVMARGAGQARVHLVGGLYKLDSAESVGPEAIEQISRYNADYAVVGVSALDPTAGPTAADYDEAMVARAMCAHARKIIIVAHADKFNRQSAYRICRMEEVDLVIGSGTPDPALRALFKSAGVALL